VADITTIAAPAVDTFVQYGALGVVSLIALVSTGALVWRAFKKADQDEADCKKRDELRQAEIAALRIELASDRQRLHDSIDNLAAIARAIGRATVDKQIETDKILFRK
jgi:hypothetical protein